MFELQKAFRQIIINLQHANIAAQQQNKEYLDRFSK